MGNLAYSYLRFSTPEQATGDSRRRQLAMAEKYAAAHGLTLDQQLSFRDLGVSAFRSRNAREGALRAFLDAIDHGLVPRGSTLLVESLDRLSRDHLLTAQALFLQIVQAGVTLVTLMDNRAYSMESLSRNPLDLVVSLVIMMRANEESATKSLRIREAWAAKLAQSPPGIHTSRCPGWIRLDKAAGKFVVVEERAEVVRRIYRERLAGEGVQTIARRLNEELVPLFGHGNQRGKMWTRSFVRQLLQRPASIGTFVPCTTVHEDGVRRVLARDPIPNYYPAIIGKADWDRIQAQREAWSKHHRCDVPKTGRANLLARLAKCPFCFGPMTLTYSGDPNWRYYNCFRQYNGLGCSDRWVRYPGIEDAITRDIGLVIKGCPLPVHSREARRQILRSLQSNLHKLRKRRDQLIVEKAELLKAGRRGARGIEAVNAEIARLLEERRRMRSDRPRWLDVTLRSRLDELLTLGTALPLDRVKLNLALRALLIRVVIDWERGRLVFHWKHGGESSVPAWMEPQRTVQNPRRADKPRLGPGTRLPPLPEVVR